jgi:hypothetical protein
MHPHVRLIAAAVAFSAALGTLLALAGVILGWLLWSEPPVSPTDDAPIRAVAALIFIVAPIVAVSSLVLSIPASYLVWNRPRMSFLGVALACCVIAILVVGFLMVRDSTLSSTITVVASFAAIMILSAWIWWLALPRSNTSFERTREG